MTLTMHLYRRLMMKGRVFWLVLLASVPGVIIAVAGIDMSSDGLAEAFVAIMMSVGFTYAIAALILTVSTLRDERDAGTLPYIYMRPIPRPTIAASSLLAGTLAAATIGLGGWLSTVLAGLIHGAPMSLMLPGAALLVSAAVGYAAIFVPVGYLFSRSVLIGLGYVVLVELALSGLVSGLAQLSIWRIAGSIYVDLVNASGIEVNIVLGPVAPGAGGGALKLAVVVVLGAGLLTWALRRRDAL
ncbi:MAG TPA: ABC transporter permease [Acidimicrobiia bacterium]|nr:ABC transporter permease [Acidimicrobiia bacterium]